jgi:DNA-binding NarL/FixJ family response regulator
MSDPIRILLIEDHEMVRAGFQMLLEAQPDMEIVGQAESGETGLALADECRPHVVLLDVSMPGMGGAQAARALKSRLPDVKILAVTIHSSKAYLLEMLDAGADGYLPKRAAAEELVNAIRTVHAGRTYIYAGLIDALVEGYRTRTEEPQDEASPEELTPRQHQVLLMIADGMTSQRIADELGLSVRTVDRHVENMMNRLGIHSRIELVKYAIREGLIEVSD